MKRLLLVPLALLFALYGCSKGADEKTDAKFGPENKVKIVATIGMIGDVASAIGGNRAEVYTMMGPGIDPHLYQAKAGDVERLNNANLILYNGLHLEAKMGDILERIAATHNTVAVAATFGAEELIEVDEGVYDPHVWFDVEKWQIVCRNILDALKNTDPDGAEVYTANFEAYLKELEELHRFVIQEASKIPEQSRVIITAHDAFNYFGRAYGFEVRGLQGISTVDEAGTGDVRDLADFIVERRIAAVFVETSVSTKSIQALQEAVKSRGFNVAIGGELFSDAMGSPGTPEGTYQGMVRHNVMTITAALGKGSAER